MTTLRAMSLESQHLINTTWYHVAHPKIAATVVSPRGDKFLLRFEEPVRFSGNPQAGLRVEWVCDPKLLFESTHEAFANSWEAAGRVRGGVSIWDHLNED